jgi:hypothetical protein
LSYSSRPVPTKESDSRSTTKESVMELTGKREAWNKDKLVGQKPPLKPKDIWAIRIYLQKEVASVV